MKRKVIAKVIAIILIEFLLTILIYRALPVEEIREQVILRDNAIRSNAINNKDPSLCRDLWFDDQKSDCYEMIAWKLGDIELCNKVDKNILYDCRAFVAETTGNLSICQELPDKYGGKGSCFRALAESKNDEKICDYIDKNPFDYESNKYTCYYRVAVLNKRPEVCELTSVVNRDGCYSAIAHKTSNASLCDMIIRDKEVKDYCFFQIATETKNTTLCTKITNANWTESCKREIIKG